MNNEVKFEDPNLEDVMVWLKEPEAYKKISNDIYKLYPTLYFFKKDQILSFYKAFKNLQDKNEFKIVFQNLAYLYPLSSNIILHIIENDERNNENEITGLFLDIYSKAENISKAFQMLLYDIKQARKGIPSRIKDLEELIGKYEKEKSETQEQRDELEKKQLTENKLAMEVKKLKKEVEDLKKYYSDENLVKEKERLEEEKGKLLVNKKEYEKNDKEIKNIQAEIKRFNEGGEYQRNLKNLRNQTKKLNHNEVV